MSIGAIKNWTGYMFLYGSTPDAFDTYLPIIDKMIFSFKIQTTTATATK
jgi:hypothetical protein